MKKFFCISILLILFLKSGMAQELIQTADGEVVGNDYELTDKQFSAWKSIQNNWLGTEYEIIKSENKINLNCKNCEAFYIEVIVKIGSNGKFEGYEVLKGKRCGVGLTKEMEARMMRKFYKFDYPFELRGTKFKTRLGSALKC